MKQITLVFLVVCTLMSCSKLYKNDTILSKYSNDTLYTKVVPTNEKVVFNDANVVFEKTVTPSLKVMQKKAGINAATAEEWLKKGTSDNTVMTTDSGLTGWGIALIILGIIVLIVAILLFLAAKEIANGIAGIIDAVRQGFNR